MKYLRNQNENYTGSDLLNEFFGWPLYENKKNSLLKTDIEEKEGEYVLDVDIPGYKKENISINVSDGYLTVEANKSAEHDENKKANYVCHERTYDAVSRTFYLGDVNEEDIKAKYDGGVLNIVVPKKKEQLPEKKVIAIE